MEAWGKRRLGLLTSKRLTDRLGVAADKCARWNMAALSLNLPKEDCAGEQFPSSRQVKGELASLGGIMFTYYISTTFFLWGNPGMFSLLSFILGVAMEWQSSALHHLSTKESPSWMWCVAILLNIWCGQIVFPYRLKHLKVCAMEYWKKKKETCHQRQSVKGAAYRLTRFWAV